MPITYSEQFLKIRLCVKVSGVDSSATAEGAGRVKVTAQQRNGVRKEQDQCTEDHRRLLCDDSLEDSDTQLPPWLRPVNLSYFFTGVCSQLE